MSENLDYTDIADEHTKATPLDALELVRGLALELLSAQRVVAEREASLEKAQAALKDIAEKRLPQLMEDKQLPGFTFRDPSGAELEITLDEDFQISVTTGQKGGTDKRPAAFAFFRSIGLGGLIKKQFVANLGLRGDNVVGDIVAAFREKNPDLSVKIEEKIEPATLKAEIKKRLVAGKEVPTEVFTIHRQRLAKVKAS